MRELKLDQLTAIGTIQIEKTASQLTSLIRQFADRRCKQMNRLPSAIPHDSGTIRAVIHHGMIVPQQPIHWPEGTEVEITTCGLHTGGMSEAEQGDSPEAAARWIAELKAIPTPIWSDRDQKEWEKRRAEDRAWELANAEVR